MSPSRARRGSAAGAGPAQPRLAPANKLKQLKHRGKSHWWLVDSDGRVIDLTLAARETSNFPYARGKGRAFRYTPAGLSRRARTVVERVRAARG